MKKNAENVDLKNNEETFNSYKLEILCYWITQKVKPNKNIDYDKLKEKLIKIFGKLPEILEDNTTYLNTESEMFIEEILGRIEYSSTVKYLLVTKIRKISFLLRNLFLIIGIVFFMGYQITIRQVVTNNFDFINLIIAIVSFIFSSFCKKLSEIFFNHMICTMKPGDYLKIINSNDELIEEKVKINQLSKNETMFNKTTIYQSRNQLLCENFLKTKSKNGKYN